VAVYKLCRELNIHLSVEWVSRDYNVEADQLSNINYPNDYMLDCTCVMKSRRKYLFLETSRMSSHAMFVPEPSIVTLWNILEHSTE